MSGTGSPLPRATAGESGSGDGAPPAVTVATTGKAAVGASRVRPLVLAFAVAVTLLGGVLWPVMAVIDRRDAVLAAERLVQGLVALQADQIRRTVESADLILLHVVSRVADDGLDRVLASPRTAIDIRTLAEHLPAIGSVALTDADGTILFSTLSTVPAGSSVADRAYYRAHRDEGAAFVIGPAVRGRLSNRIVFTVSRPLPTPGDGFGGVVVAALDTGTFRTLYETLRLGGRADRGEIAVYRDDGELLVRFPMVDGEPVRSGHDSTLFDTLLAGADQGLSTVRSPLDGVERFLAFQRVARTPLVVTAAIDRDAALAGWHERTAWAALLFGGWLLCVVGLGFLTLGSVRREAAAMAVVADVNGSLERRVEERTADLRAAKEDAERESRAKSHFLANVSHELRTPLNAVIGFSELMGTGFAGPLTDKQRQYLDTIHQSGSHLLHIINDILDLSKISAERLEIVEQEIRVEVLVEACIELSRGRALDRTLALEAKVEPGLPPFWGDELRMKQILINLLSNAIKFTPDPGTVTVRAARTAEGGLELAVADTGIGMAPEEIPRALAMFGQVDTELTRTHEGTGIGLPIAKGLVELHGGTMTIHSARGAGTTVLLRFPVERLARPGSSSGPAV